MNHRLLLAGIAAIAFALPAIAEDGYDLWLRYRPVESPIHELVANEASPTLDAAQAELVRGLSGLAGAPVGLVDAPTQPGAVVFGTPRSSPRIAGLSLGLDRAGSEGYVIRSVDLDGKRATVIAANSDIGVLYGA